MLSHPGSGIRRRPGAAILFFLALLGALAIARPLAVDAQVPPGPIDPDNGEQNLLDIINALPLNDVESALDQFPVPYVVYATANGAQPTVVTQRAGSPTRIDADRSKTTGQGGGGQDLIVEVNTQLVPTPGLLLSVDRLGTGNFAQDLQIVVAFPFAAFGSAATNGTSPNLFVGYQTTAAFDALNDVYPAGGNAPQSVDFLITPGALAGTGHTFDLSITTVQAPNPIQFLTGHFQADAGGDIENAIAMGILTDPVPATINLGITTGASLPGAAGLATGSFGIDWDASAPTKAIFDYIEAEDFPFAQADYGTSVQFNQMPTHEEIDVAVDLPNNTLGLSLSGNAPTNEVTVTHSRSDGLDVLLEAFQVPTDVDVTLDLNGSVAIDVNANTMDFELTATQDGGFPGSNGLFGYPLEFFYVAATDVPDTAASWTGTTFAVNAVNPGESIGSLSFVIDDDATAIDDGLVQLPPDQTPLATGVAKPWADENRHVFSIVDDGTHGTVAARLVQVITAELNFSAADLANISESYTLTLAEPAQPLTAYAMLTPDSILSDDDIELVCNVHNFPHGTTTFDLALPPPEFNFTFETDPDGQQIDEFFCLGHINTLNFEAIGADIPAGIEVSFIPASASPGGAGSLTIDTPSPVGIFGLRLWDEDDPLGLDAQGFNTASLLGAPLNDARFRVDDVPSLTATWTDDGTGTNIDFGTPGPGVLGGLQVGVSTNLGLATPFAGATSTSGHYASFLSNDDEKTLKAGAFGIDSFSYASNDGAGSMTLDYLADAARQLTVDVDSAFGGPFFPAYDIDAVLTATNIPQEFHLSTNLATSLVYTASGGIGSISLTGDIDNSGPDTTDQTHVDVQALGLPSSVNFSLTPASNASLVMNAPIDLITLELDSDVSIFGSNYRLIQASLDDIPAKWNANWAGGDLLVEATDAADNPSAMGPVTALVSTSNDDATNAGKIQPFMEVPAGNQRVARSGFQAEIDTNYWPTGVLGRLDRIYGDAEVLDIGEDHLVIRNSGGALDFASAKVTGFQKLMLAPNSAGVDYELRAPVAGAHPLFVGIAEDTTFSLIQIENVPDSLTLDVNIPGRQIHFLTTDDLNATAGEIDFYRGPLPIAQDGQEATRLIMTDTPSQVDITWNFGIPNGNAVFEANDVFGLDFLMQDSSQRIIAGLDMQRIELNYGFDILSFDVLDTIGFDPCAIATLGLENCPIEVPIEWELLGANANLIVTPGIDGYFALYEFKGGLQNLSTGAAPDGSEYVPFITAMVKDFTGVNAFVGLSLDPTDLGATFYPIDFTVNVDFDGQFVFDIWSNVNTHEVFTIDAGVFSADIGFINPPDYITNDPFHIIPFDSPQFGIDHDAVITFDGFHTFNEHVDPFS